MCWWQKHQEQTLGLLGYPAGFGANPRGGDTGAVGAFLWVVRRRAYERAREWSVWFEDLTLSLPFLVWPLIHAVVFGAAAVDGFLARTGFTHIIRAHQPPELGVSYQKGLPPMGGCHGDSCR